jgi:hypothetical protein
VVWLLLVAQSHAPQSSAASAAVTPSGPSGIADRVPPPPDGPSCARPPGRGGRGREAG